MAKRNTENNGYLLRIREDMRDIILLFTGYVLATSLKFCFTADILSFKNSFSF